MNNMQNQPIHFGQVSFPQIVGYFPYSWIGVPTFLMMTVPYTLQPVIIAPDVNELNYEQGDNNVLDAFCACQDDTVQEEIKEEIHLQY